MGRPQAAEAREPGVQLGEPGRVERVDSALRLAADADEPGLAEQPQVLRDGRRGHIESACDLARGMFSDREHLDDPLPGGVGQCRELEHVLVIRHLLN